MSGKRDTVLNGRVLTIAGSDSSGGAGIQADIKTITALGAYAATAITAVTAQNTQNVSGIHPMPAAFVQQQIVAVLEDIGADAIKTGMLCDRAIVEMLCHLAPSWSVPLVIDPVMIASSGRALLAADAVMLLRDRLLPLATLVTPNVPEAASLTGLPITDQESLQNAALALRARGLRAVLLKGGHLPGDMVTDILVTPDTLEQFTAPRLSSHNTHGTGCTLASGIATGLAQGLNLTDSVRRARAFVRAAILTAPGYGKGHGPMNHAIIFDPTRCAP